VRWVGGDATVAGVEAGEFVQALACFGRCMALVLFGSTRTTAARVLAAVSNVEGFSRSFIAKVGPGACIAACKLAWCLGSTSILCKLK
jgi:hypothetical protein